MDFVTEVIYYNPAYYYVSLHIGDGRRAFIDHNGLPLLLDMCDNATPKNRDGIVKQECDLTPLVPTASIILRKCFPRNKLPLPNYDSPLRFPLPQTLVSAALTASVLPPGAMPAVSASFADVSSRNGPVASCKLPSLARVSPDI